MRLNKILQPKVVPTSSMLDLLTTPDRNYLIKKLYEIKYVLKHLPLSVWLKLGDRLKLNGISFNETIFLLREYKNTNPTLGENINDTLSKIK